MGALGVFLDANSDIDRQLRWASRLARSSDCDLLVLYRVESREDKVVSMSLAAPPDNAALVLSRIRQAVRESEDLRERPAESTDGDPSKVAHGDVVFVEVKEVRAPDAAALRRHLLAEVRSNRLKRLTIVRDELESGDVDEVRERRLFLRHVACEVVYCFGLREETDPKRFLVAIAGGLHGTSALRLAADMAEAGEGRLTALRVNPSVGQDAEQVGERRLSAALRSLDRERQQVEHRVVVDDHIYSGVRRVWEEGRHDIIVLGASRLGVLGSQIGRGLSGKLLKGEPRPVVVIVSAASPVANRLLGLVEGGIELLVPQIDRENRVNLVDRVQSSSNQNFDFVALMVLSTVIAAIGLIQNSAAVVIGAMLVAPLMTPLLGLGLALMQGNPLLARISVRLVLTGVAVSLLVGAFVGWATPAFVEPTREMLGRGGPGLLDLFIAFSAGLAAAYASSRPGLVAALPGVAIAAALVPPIATAGLALALGDLHLAGGALLLFFINGVTIVLASMIALWSVGLRTHKRTSRWTVLAAGAFMLAVLGLGLFLGIEGERNGPAMRVPEDLDVAIRARIGAEYRLHSVAVVYDELGIQLLVRIEGEGHAPEELAQEIRRLTREAFTRPVRVRLHTEVRREDGRLGESGMER
jgi:uncharacterized hydrophobic protein (TIGR00271 family)